MNRKTLGILGTVTLAAALAAGAAHGRGFGGFRAGAGGFRGGGGFGGFHANFGGFHEGYGGGYGGRSMYGRTPSMSSAGTFERSGGAFRGYNPYSGGREAGGYRTGSYTGPRGTSVDYGAVGRAATGPGGAEAARGVGGVQMTTAGGRSFTEFGRAGGVDGSRAGAMGYGGGYRPNGYNAYGGYHSGWVNGYWNGHGADAWGWRGGYWDRWGLGMGWGLPLWGFGSALYGMGYLPYSNPYYGLGVGGAAVGPYDYSQPIDTVSAPAADDVATQSVSTFDAARASFRQGDYAGALKQADSALAQTPSDTALHEFRAACLFALQRYDEAAAALYAVLSVGPGWDWATLVGLYPDVETYTAQLRTLEEACKATPSSAADRIVLAYHYLTQGHVDAGVNRLREVVALKPDDSLSARLLAQLAPPSSAAPAATVTAATPSATPATASQPATDQPPAGATIAGTWTARPATDTAITLDLKAAGPFTWSVAKGGKASTFSGESTYGSGLLTLSQDKGPALVGRVSWADPSHMTFRIAGDGPSDPGLSFSR